MNDFLESINPNARFDTGTIDGLALKLGENRGSVISLNDEFSTFIDGLDNGKNSVADKSRILSLYNGSSWSKKTKTSGSFHLSSTRFNLVAFTQPNYLINFSRDKLNQCDGFFQRFLIGCPQEVYIKMEEQQESLKRTNDNVNMGSVLKDIFDHCKEPCEIHLSKEAAELYKEYFNGIVDFRYEEKYDDNKVSIKSKSRGLSLRIAGVLALLRHFSESHQRTVSEEAHQSEELPSTSNSSEISYDEVKVIEITKDDYSMALNITNYSVNIAFKLIEPTATQNPEHGKETKGKQKLCKKNAIPIPEEFTMEYALENANFVRRLCSTATTSWDNITRNSIYPKIDGVRGAEVAKKFLKGLEILGLGRLSPKSKCFKRKVPSDHEESLQLSKKFKLFHIDLNSDD